MIRGHRQDTSTGISSTVIMARYLPITTVVMEAGEVSSNWSVRLWRSSAMDRMVSSGTSTMNRNSTALSA